MEDILGSQRVVFEDVLKAVILPEYQDVGMLCENLILLDPQ
jgi:hypothetical protein